MIFGTNNTSATNEQAVLENLLASIEVGEVDSTPAGLQIIVKESAKELADFNSALYISDTMITEKVLKEGAEVEPLMEAFVKDSWTRLKAMFTKFWAKVRAWFTEAKQALKTLFISGKKLVDEYGDQLHKKSTQGFTYTGYPFSPSDGVSAYENRAAKITAFLKSEVNFDVTAGQKAVTGATGEHGQENHIKDSASGDKTPNTDESKQKLLNDLNAKSTGDVMASIRKAFRGGVDETTEIKDLKRDEMIAFLKAAESNVKAIEKAQKTMDEEFKAVLSSIDRAKSSIASSGMEEKAKARATAYATHKYNVAHYALTLQQSMSSTLVAAFNETAREYTRVLKSFLRFKPAKEGFAGTDEEGQEPLQESSLLDLASTFL